jgi:hypothetical protein
MTDSKKRKTQRTNKTPLIVKSDLRMPGEILQWELELLSAVLNAVRGNEQAGLRQSEAPE